MKTYAVIDIGTNSARLMIAQVSGRKIGSSYKTLSTIRVGEGMTQERRISQAAMLRARAALLGFKRIAQERGADSLLCFATSAVRDAQNSDEFVRYIRLECGIDIDILSGQNEASLGFAGAVEKRGGMFDIGGGSTEVMTGSLQNVQFQESFRLGTVRCLQMFPDADNADEAAFLGAHQLAADTFAKLHESIGFTYVGIGGTATALAAIDLGLYEYDPDKVQGHRISLTRAQALCTTLKSKTKMQRQKIIGLEENRADVIVFGAIILLEFMKAVHASQIVVSDRDNLEGYLAMKLGHFQIHPG